MATINSVHLVGRLARDPRMNKGENWTSALLTICTTDKFKTRGGEDKEVTLFTNVTLWNDEALDAEKYLKKGVAVSIDGRLKLDEWIDKKTNLERKELRVQVITIMYLEKLQPLPLVGDEKQSVYTPSELRPTQQKLVAPPTEEEYDELPF